MSKIPRVIFNANKNKDKIKANIRLKKNGQFSSVSGIVSDLKVSRDGSPYVVFKKFEGDNKWQNVRLSNIRAVIKDNKIYR